MEIINQRSSTNSPKAGASCCKQGHHLFLGIVFIVAGIVWMLHNFGLLSAIVTDTLFSWQMLITLIGVYLLTLRRWVGGVIITATGCVLLVSQLLGLVISLSKVILPLLAIAVGVALLSCSCKRNDKK